MKTRPMREPILWTERTYPCGCSARGAGDIPPYCATHDYEAACEAIGKKNNRCYDCGATVIFYGCQVCGAPQCCPQCCRIDELEGAIEPFANLIADSSGRIPTEKLSMADWHGLAKVYARRKKWTNP